MKRRVFLLPALAVAGLLALATGTPAASAASGHAANHSARNVATSQAAATAVHASATTAVQLFASEVETLGANHYPSSFAGAAVTSAGVTDVYALKASDAALVTAINALNKSGYLVSIIGVSRSYNQLNALNAALGRAYAHLMKDGIRLVQSWPDPSSGSVVAAIMKPAKADISALGSAAASPTTSSNYRTQTSGLLQREFGKGITLQSRYAVPFVAAGRNNDTAPFYDGDQIYRSGVTCTGGFNMTGNRSGHVFMYTAGHCGSGTWATGAQTVGSTSTNYLSSTSGNDFQSIYLANGGLGVTWTNGANLAPVTGQLLPAVGAAITFNGSVTGEVRGNTVTAVGITVYGIYNSVGGYYYDATYQVEASNPNGTYCVRPGDSGGPAYSHTPGSNVLAVGVITGYYYTGGPAGGSTCIATEIGHLESVTDTSLLTSG
jgi:hypothetical protein